MALQYPGGTIINRTFTATNNALWSKAVIQACLDAGWTSIPTNASHTLNYAGQPSDGDTVTPFSNGASPKTYTFRTVINNAVANEVLIGANTAASAANLAAAVNAGAGAGTTYSSATTANTQVTASSGATTTVFIKITVGIGGIETETGTSTETGANLSFATTNFTGANSRILSAKTPQGMRMAANFFMRLGDLYDASTNRTGITVQNPSGSVVSGDLISGSSGGGYIDPIRTFRVIANRYQVLVFAVGLSGSATNTVAGNWFVAGTPYLTDFLAPFIVSNATNASPIQITTTTTHDLTTGQSVTIVGAEGNTAANGTFVVTVLDTTNFTLNGSVGNGTYTANSAVAINSTLQSRIYECFFACGTNAGGSPNWRSDVEQEVINAFGCVNGLAVSNSSGAANSSNVGLVVPSITSQGFTENLQWYNGQFAIGEPIVYWGKVWTGSAFIMGQLYGAALVRRSLIHDTVVTFSGHDWMVVGSNPGAGRGWALLFVIS